MFGLMKACSCNKSSEERELQRMHYCGTCKTIGRLYGQKARVFLNYDAVFLGEILTDLQPRPLQFAPAYVSKSCLALPKSDQIPWTLEYAAAANVVLAQFKLLDHVADSGSKLIKLAVRTYSDEFQRASDALNRCKFPFKELQRLMALQAEREKESRPQLDRLAEPTAGATRLVFAHGALTAGASHSTAETMANLGSVFGEIAYLVDALKDQKKDAEKCEFNALAATGMRPWRARKLLGRKRHQMLGYLNALPIDEARKQNYATRLDTNLAPHLFMRRRPERVIIVRERRSSFCGDCCDAICCCETINCCECLGDGCCQCIGGGCGVLS